MNIQELGSLGEFVGAIAVIFTLVYLSIQTRLSRIAAEETSKFASQQTTHLVLDVYSKWRNSLICNPVLAAIIVKARGNKQLTEEEQVLFSAYIEELIFASATSYTSGFSGASVHDETADSDHMVAVLLANPRAINDWNRMRETASKMSREFVEAVDSELDKAEKQEG